MMDLRGNFQRLWVSAGLLCVAMGVGCATGGRPAVDTEKLPDGVAHLSRPMSGDLAALYDLRVARSGGLRLSVITAGSDGRLTISEPFGSAASLTAWSNHGPAIFFDMSEGCRREVEDLEEVIGVGTLPLGQAVRLLGGRLPVMPGDAVDISADGLIEVHGIGWAARLRLAPDPWRIVDVGELRSDEAAGWHLELSAHTSSVPGKILLEKPDGKWAELELKRMEWPDGASLPDLPTFPPCAGW